MPQDELSGPDLAGAVADADAVELDYVVIGGFSVIYHGHVRATKDSDLLVPDGPDADAAVLRFLERVRVAALASVVGFKRLAGRPQDRLDLAELEALYGPLPIEPIPGLDDMRG
jgi:hypothetical protein